MTVDGNAHRGKAMWKERLVRMNIRRSSLVAAALLAALGAASGQVAAASLVPFQATVYEHYTIGPCAPATVCILATGTGQATHLGEVAEYATVRVDVNPAHAVNGCSPEQRSTVLVAANGDEVLMSATGWGCHATNSAHDSYTAAGTGRFQGATGSGADDVADTLTGPGVGVAWVTYTGDLSSPGSLQ
jgi:hypothetical protein